jgi:hypothetical protein
MLECFHLLTTPLRHLPIWLEESSVARIWTHHRPVLVGFVDPGMLFEKGHYPDYQMLEYTELDCKKNIWYDNCHLRDAFHKPQGFF